MNNQKPDNNYDFIMNQGGQNASKLHKILPSGNSMLGRLVVVFGLIIFLIAGSVLFLSFINKSKDAALNSLIDAAVYQHELIRIAEIGTEKARSQEAKDIAITTKLALQSEQSAMLAAVQKAGKKLSTKDLAAGSNKDTDTFLNTASQNNVFDDAFIQSMTQGLREYNTLVEKAYSQVTNPQLKEALQAQYESSATLLGAAGEAKDSN